VSDQATTTSTASDLEAALAAVLGFAGSTERVSRAAAAAGVVVARYVDPEGYALELDPEVVLDYTDPELFAGLVAIAVRIYQDPASPAGILGSDAYTGAYVPSDLLEHVRHYFDHRRVRGAWGIA
jgi:hypothetical protein